jgi:hypothetical protein
MCGRDSFLLVCVLTSRGPLEEYGRMLSEDGDHVGVGEEGAMGELYEVGFGEI